ncbi:zinc transporter 10 isoform X2 [Megalops cyprinoides]|uniref:zinc transporter 10 isoform X2 n=1 Tax=Megalops cyprinoides TaxID=118141 RepID=UPI00186445D3|nr:zinc transporter 10 isoform X2 [Megalops cyprinoides]
MGRYSGKTCRLIFMLVLTVVFFVAEIVAGYMGNSIALVSDSFNMLSDLLSLCVGLTAARVSRRASSGRCTYGLPRAEVVGALANAVFLAALCFCISVEALQRLARPEAIADPGLVLVVGALGLAVNVVGLFIFQDFSCCRGGRRRRRQENCARAQQMTEKEAGENGEAGAPVLNEDNPGETGQEKQGQPLNIRVEDLSGIPGVQGLHEIHIWELARGRNIATLHVKCVDQSSFGDLSQRVREVFHRAGVHSVTIQPEFTEGRDGLLCSTPCLSPACQDQSCCSGAPPTLPVCNGHPATPTLEVTVSVPLEGVQDKVMETHGEEGRKNVDSTKF